MSKLSDDILDEPYTDMMRKFKTYRAIDKVQETSPILAYPILDEKGGALASGASEKAHNNLYSLIGQGCVVVETEKVEPIPEDIAERFLTGADGPLVDINDLINRGKDNG